MKKIFMGVGAVASAAVPVAAVVSCGSDDTTETRIMYSEVGPVGGSMYIGVAFLIDSTLTAGKLSDAIADELAKGIAVEIQDAKYVDKTKAMITIPGHNTVTLTLTDTAEATILAAIKAATFVATP